MFFRVKKRILIPSPKSVATYDLKPEMSALEIADELVKALKSEEYSLIVVNFANGDMVGHTGVESAAIKAVETLDKCLSLVVNEAIKHQYETFISADHGNCEQMLDFDTHDPFTQHTTNLVPLIWVSEKAKSKKLSDGTLADLAPTVLEVMGIEKPKEMTGHSLILK
jgi:2,3-bisphosphoglycerate-independent phosphoglycerate mutase